MAEFHNFSALKAIYQLENELLAVRDALRECPGYDPAESLADNAKMIVRSGSALADLLREVNTLYRNLKKEHENDKEVARSYPLAGDYGFRSVVVPQTVRTIAWFGPDGVPTSDPFESY